MIFLGVKTFRSKRRDFKIIAKTFRYSVQDVKCNKYLLLKKQYHVIINLFKVKLFVNMHVIRSYLMPKSLSLYCSPLRVIPNISAVRVIL